MPNMFKCTLASGTNSGIPLIVTCASDFAGLTITCTDGTTTLTDTCPSSSPYEITFELPNDGSWTVSGEISGTTYSESILIQPYDVELITNVDITVDFYSAANDTVSYIGIDGQSHTIVTDSSGHASATITIAGQGSSLTFTSSVAKDPSNLSSAYSKTISLSRTTSSVYFMPDGDVMYWYGFIGDDTEIISAANGWTCDNSNVSFSDPTFNTNSMIANGGSNLLKGIGKVTSSAFNGTHHLISTGQSNTGIVATNGSNKYIAYSPVAIITPSSNTVITHQQSTYSGGHNVIAQGRAASNNQFTVYAWWCETT